MIEESSPKQVNNEKKRLINSSLTNPFNSPDNKQHKQSQLTTSPVAHNQDPVVQKQLIKGLLRTLGFHNTSKTFQKESKRKQSSNPEDSGSKSVKNKYQKEEGLGDRLDKILEQSRSFDQMIDFLETTMKKQEKTLHEDEKQKLQEQYEGTLIERAIQNLFKRKIKLLVPIFKTLELNIQERQVMLIDIDREENVCFIDNKNYLHLVKNGSDKVRVIKLENYQFIALKWMSSQLILALTAFNCLLFFQAQPLGIIKTAYNQRDNIKFNQIHKVNSEVYVLSCSLTHLYSFRINFQGINVHVDSSFMLKQTEPLRAITVGLSYSQSWCKQKGFKRGTTEHFYGVTQNKKYLMKYDTLVQRAGVFWKAPKHSRIQKLFTSKCKRYLIILLVHIFNLQKGSFNPTLLDQIPFNYQIIKLDDSGCVIEKTNHHFNFKDFPISFLSTENSCNYLTKTLSLSHQMEPWWLHCFCWQNQLYFFSLITGSVVYRHSADEQSFRVRFVGPSNCVAYEKKSHLFLMSTKDVEKRTMVIQKEREKRFDFRDRIMHRLQRMQGIPDNLLILLRSMRTTELQDLDLL